MKDVVVIESNSALAVVVKPLEAITQTWHVVNKTHRQCSPDCDLWDVMLPGVFPTKLGMHLSASED